MKENLLPKHIAIIMDGNRRWAKARNLNPSLGHKEGAEVLKKIAKYANKKEIKYLTVYAFSTENWKRSKEEVDALMILLQKYIEEFLTEDMENIRVRIVGDASKFGNKLKTSIENIQKETENNTGLILNIALNYGGRDEIIKSVQKIASDVKHGKIEIDDINEQVVNNSLYTAGQPDPDLMIRTGGEQRISNYLLWQLAYTEFLFVEKYWPDFTPQDLDNAIAVFQTRNRKFGGK